MVNSAHASHEMVYFAPTDVAGADEEGSIMAWELALACIKASVSASSNGTYAAVCA